MSDNFWTITPRRATSIAYQLNEYNAEKDCYPNKIHGYLLLPTQVPVVVEEGPNGDVILANGKFVILWDEIEILAQRGNINLEHAPHRHQADCLLGLVHVTSNGGVVEVPVHDYVNGKYIPTGKVYLEEDLVYDCPKHGEEAIEYCYGLQEVYITAETLHELLRKGVITISD